ncbi:MAG: hypothetical protein JSS86_05855 [Cyanobacteria bacterium SZAS LIN-2]|nr:hypothetical protein [Cyanobacteria bacterium SZAS LIN-3]MBS1995812.1 hypothetical protein [Cyanobacteria bacterium SZAS LIN-2]
MKALILGLLSASIVSITTMPEAFAVKTEIKAQGNLLMNEALKAYQNNVLQVVTKECLAQKAAVHTDVNLTVDAHGNIVSIVFQNSGLSSDATKQLLTALQTTKLGDAGENQTDTLRITFEFTLAEVLAGAKSTGTSIKVTGGSITGDGTPTGGVTIGKGAKINAGRVIINGVESGGGGVHLNAHPAPAEKPQVRVDEQTDFSPDAKDK